MWALCSPARVEPALPAWHVRVLTVGQPGRSLYFSFKEKISVKISIENTAKRFE